MLANNEYIAQLNPRQKTLMAWLYDDIVNNSLCTKSNQDISNTVGIPVSTIEKYLLLFEKLRLIKRTSDRVQDLFTGDWKTTNRTIQLDPRTFDPTMIALERQKRIENLLDLLDNPEFRQRQTAAILEKRGKACTT